jgi:hypothetical protein
VKSRSVRKLLPLRLIPILFSPRILLVDQDIWNIEDDFIPSPAGDGMKIGFSRPPDGVPA